MGGYDAALFKPINLTFPIKNSLELSLGLQSISATNVLGGVAEAFLLPNGILTSIDSTVPEIWLPVEACTLFEKAFGLQHGNTTDRSLVNSTINSQLLLLDPAVTFSIANQITDSDSVEIVIPYAAFDLEASWPIYPNTTNYFPLRRAADEI